MRKTEAFFICAVLVAATSAAAQVRDDRYPVTTGTIPPAVSSVRSAEHDWSGESGASGHPLMTAEAIRAAAANFHVSWVRAEGDINARSGTSACEAM